MKNLFKFFFALGPFAITTSMYLIRDFFNVLYKIGEISRTDAGVYSVLGIIGSAVSIIMMMYFLHDAYKKLDAKVIYRTSKSIES